MDLLILKCAKTEKAVTSNQRHPQVIPRRRAFHLKALCQTVFLLSARQKLQANPRALPFVLCP
jgi:hypothetical protein